MKTFHILTLGCKVNQYESERVAQMLQNGGYTPAGESLISGENSENTLDLCVINSCAVTAEAEAKTRKTVRQVIKRHHPRRVIVFGCSATRNPQSFREIPGVTDVITAEDTGGNRVAAVAKCLFGEEKWHEFAENSPGLEAFGERHRAYIKIQDGCKQFCTYCIVPHLRKTLCSVPVEEVACETRGLVARGYREIVLTGIHLGYYGQGLRSRVTADWRAESQTGAGTNLATVVRRLVALDGDFRIRISSLEAEEATDELLGLMAAHPQRICPHLHLSMQSGANSVLKRMNRPGTAEAYFARCAAAKQTVSGIALTTDIIVGFPGETEAEFLETCEMAKQIGFSKIHIFRFSPREGTPAANMPGRVPGEEKHRRAAHLATLETEMRHAFFTRQLGTEMQVLVENVRPSEGEEAGKYVLRGTSERYIPVKFHAGADLSGQFARVKAVRVMADEDGIFGGME